MIDIGEGQYTLRLYDPLGEKREMEVKGGQKEVPCYTADITSSTSNTI